METSEAGLIRPKEVTWALIAIGVLVVAGTAVTVAFRMIEAGSGVPVNVWRHAGTVLNIAVSLAYLFGLANGYGWVRWMFVLSLGVSVLFLAFLLLSWMGTEGRNHMIVTFMAVVEAPLVVLRIAIVVLLFRPAAAQWFERKYAERTAAA
jgi:hypothetical protein